MNIERSHVNVINLPCPALPCSGVADDAAMRRVFELAAKIPNSSLSVANYESLVTSPGVAQLLAAAAAEPPPLAEAAGPGPGPSSPDSLTYSLTHYH